ncbi:hypothetical protein ACDZ29_25585 [Peribacillus sp. RS7]|uniref:hypothetical protein n=1 Tax=Peribacillus sp. RS7 TaxID=3242679 RepID=UPI0035C216CB
MNYRFVVIEYPLVETIQDKNYKDIYVGLGIKNTISGIILPLPITKFLEEYRNNSQGLKSQKNAAESIKRFLNYCLVAAHEHNYNDVEFAEFINLRYQGIQGLKLEHGSIYITNLARRCKYEELDSSYAKKEIRYLIKFYYYLLNEGLIEQQFEPLYKEKAVSSESKSRREKKKILIEVDIFKQSFLGTVYPSPRRKKRKRNLKDFGENRYQLVKEFIETAESTEPDIVPGLYLQFFGGLRRGEVINLTRDSLMETADGYIVDIDDNRELLFSSKKRTDEEQVKYPRYQGVFWHRAMKYSFVKHEKWLKNLEKEGKLKNSHALLINRHTKRPITGANYAEKFIKVKETFLNELTDKGRLIDLNFLTAKPWSTHIGRGIFTNFCLDIGMKLGEVAVARGDNDINSLLDYIEEKVAVQSLRKAMNHIQTAYIDAEQLPGGSLKISSNIDSLYVSSWEMQNER